MYNKVTYIAIRKFNCCQVECMAESDLNCAELFLFSRKQLTFCEEREERRGLIELRVICLNCTYAYSYAGVRIANAIRADPILSAGGRENGLHGNYRFY